MPEPIPNMQRLDESIMLKVPGDLMAAIANYLMERPWREVNRFLARIQQDCKPIMPETPKTEEASKG